MAHVSYPPSEAPVEAVTPMVSDPHIRGLRAALARSRTHVADQVVRDGEPTAGFAQRKRDLERVRARAGNQLAAAEARRKRHPETA
jgi:hypothetical protein